MLLNALRDTWGSTYKKKCEYRVKRKARNGRGYSQDGGSRTYIVVRGIVRGVVCCVVGGIVCCVVCGVVPCVVVRGSVVIRGGVVVVVLLLVLITLVSVSLSRNRANGWEQGEEESGGV